MRHQRLILNNKSHNPFPQQNIEHLRMVNTHHPYSSHGMQQEDRNCYQDTSMKMTGKNSHF